MGDITFYYKNKAVKKNFEKERLKKNMKRKVLAVTGIRSEYDILYPVIDTLRKDKNFSIKLVVCGAHLSDWHGVTLKKIEKDGFKIADKIDYLLMTNRVIQRAKGVGILTYALSQTAEREKPDILLVVADREESIATAIVGNYMNILTAHVGGGDSVYGNSDDPIRFAVSKLAHIHFTFSGQYADNLEKIGEEKFRIFNTGNPSLDNIRHTPSMSIHELRNALKFRIGAKKYAVLIQHPLSSEVESSYTQMEITLNALTEFSEKNTLKTVAIYPNTDPGSYDIINAIKRYERKGCIRFYKTLPRKIFINLMRNAAVLIGNSSMGLLEAPFYKLPAINVGRRQMGRLNTGNVRFVEHDKKDIKEALSKVFFDKEYKKYIKQLENPYGNGDSSKKIKDILLSINIKDRKWYTKQKLC